MGIKSLNKFLRNNCPTIYQEVHISEYSFKKVAIDTSLYLCKFKSICGDKWLTAFINLISCLRKNEVHCVFIFDTGAPPEKEEERKIRATQKVKQVERVHSLEVALEKFTLSGEIDQILIDLFEKRKKEANPPRLLKQRNDKVDMKFVEETVLKIKSQILDISPLDFKRARELFDILSVPYFNAPLEAETTCADLCKRGLVDAVLSEDTDLLAYGCPIFLSRFNTLTGLCIRINYSDMLTSLQLSSEEFLDLCIMCGCDYNKNIFRVGPEKAYKYVQEYSTIEGIATNTKLDVGVLNHLRVRELFREYEQVQYKIKYCGVPNFQRLQEFLFRHNIGCTVEGLKGAFLTQVEIVLLEENS